MKRVIMTLNEMSFDLPQDWSLSQDKYNIYNGQGFINRENYLSKSGRVISLFEVHRDPDEFFENYQNLVNEFAQVTDAYRLEKQFTLKFNDFEFPSYIIKGFEGKVIYILEVFVNCGDRLGCFMVILNDYYPSLKETIARDEAFSALTKILRTIE